MTRTMKQVIILTSEGIQRELSEHERPLSLRVYQPSGSLPVPFDLAGISGVGAAGELHAAGDFLGKDKVQQDDQAEIVRLAVNHCDRL